MSWRFDWLGKSTWITHLHIKTFVVIFKRGRTQSTSSRLKRALILDNRRARAMFSVSYQRQFLSRLWCSSEPSLIRPHYYEARDRWHQNLVNNQGMTCQRWVNQASISQFPANPNGKETISLSWRPRCNPEGVTKWFGEVPMSRPLPLIFPEPTEFIYIKPHQ